MREAELSDLEFALQLADTADRITMSYYGQAGLLVLEKPDSTPVSEADRLVEQTLRDLIGATLPTDGILGEEFGTTAGSGDGSGQPAGFGDQGAEATDSASTSGAARRRQWIIDPIDGTKNFIRGVPVWATLIALVTDDGAEPEFGASSPPAPQVGLTPNDDAATQPRIPDAPAIAPPVRTRTVQVGVVSAPALGRRWWAGVGHGAWAGGLAHPEPIPLRVSQVNSLAQATVSYASLDGWDKLGLLDDFVQLTLDCGRSRAFGDFWSYMLLAEGAVDFAIEPELEVYDMAALVPIVTEAGGTFTALDGQPGPWGGNAIASNGPLHQQVRNRLART